MDNIINFKVDDNRAKQAKELRQIGINLSVVLRNKFDEIVRQYLPNQKQQ